jgi:hypothetical protein
MKIIVAILKFLIITAVAAIKFIAGAIIYSETSILFRIFKMATIIFMFTNIPGVFLCWAEESVLGTAAAHRGQNPGRSPIGE